MKIFKSIKWRLQIWHGLILVAVLLALGLASYQLERNLLFNRIDGELERRFSVVVAVLHPRGPGPGHLPFDRPPPDQIPDDMPPPGDSGPGEFHLPAQDAALFDSSDPHNFYFRIFRGDNNLTQSTNAPTITISAEKSIVNSRNSPFGIGERVFSQILDVLNRSYQLREIPHFLPSGEIVWVGCSIAPELYELKMTALKLTGVGGIVLLIGLAGGWWISSRAIRPIEAISATAVKISAGDLSQRINAAETESELGQLAAVLNSTFARLESAFAQQKQFASDAAHELRTPVSVILTQTQTALGREREARDYKLTIEACQRGAQRMRKLISALLELARLDAGQEQMKRLRFDFSKTIADCVDLIRPLADERGVKIVTELSPVEITGDSERLDLVVTNLLNNAVQYNHDGGEIKISLAGENGMAVLTVSDTGQGIPAEDLPRVFERFYRVDKSRSPGNSGLGLAISKAIIAAHGGSIDAASEEHAGTTFTVHLPMNRFISRC